MGGGSAQGFVVDVFANGSLDEVAAGQENAAGALHNQGLVAHNRQVCAAGHTRAHYGRQLRNPEAAHHRVVAKNPAKMLFIGENFVLHRQVNACGIHQVQNGNAVLHRNLLSAKVLFARHGEPRTRLNRRVVGHHDARAPSNATKHDDDTGRRTATVLGIHAVGCKRANFHLGSVGVQQALHPFARTELTLFG